MRNQSQKGREPYSIIFLLYRKYTAQSTIHTTCTSRYCMSSFDQERRLLGTVQDTNVVLPRYYRRLGERFKLSPRRLQQQQRWESRAWHATFHLAASCSNVRPVPPKEWQWIVQWAELCLVRSRVQVPIYGIIISRRRCGMHAIHWSSSKLLL